MNDTIDKLESVINAQSAVINLQDEYIAKAKELIAGQEKHMNDLFDEIDSLRANQLILQTECELAKRTIIRLIRGDFNEEERKELIEICSK